MRSSFEFDGDELRIRLTVEDDNERAVAKLMETYSSASVSLDYGRSSMYSTYELERPKAVEIVLRKPPPAEVEPDAGDPAAFMLATGPR